MSGISFLPNIFFSKCENFKGEKALLTVITKKGGQSSCPSVHNFKHFFENIFLYSYIYISHIHNSFSSTKVASKVENFENENGSLTLFTKNTGSVSTFCRPQFLIFLKRFFDIVPPTFIRFRGLFLIDKSLF